MIHPIHFHGLVKDRLKEVEKEGRKAATIVVDLPFCAKTDRLLRECEKQSKAALKSRNPHLKAKDVEADFIILSSDTVFNAGDFWKTANEMLATICKAGHFKSAVISDLKQERSDKASIQIVVSWREFDFELARGTIF